MKIGVRLKLFLLSLVLIGVCVAAADAFVTRSVSRFVTTRIHDDLLVRTRLVAREASSYPAPLSDVTAWDALADAQGATAQARVTLLRRDGTVIGDSDVEPSAIADVENHRSRPEIVDALASGRGEGSRLSVTVHDRLLYMAVPFEKDGAVVGIARLSEPLVEVDAAVAKARRIIFIGSGIAVLLAIVMSLVATQRISEIVRELTEAARRMTNGDLTVRTRARGGDELAELGQALDHLASGLDATVAELRGERDLLGGVLENMQEGVLVLDGDGRILSMNPALRDMLMVPADGAGKLLIEVVRDAGLHELITKGRQSSTPIFGEIDLPGIKPRKLLVHAAHMSGTEKGLLAVFVDVTALRRLEAVRRDFVANVSHELRTPVAAVRSAAETLRTGALDDPKAARRFVDIIDRNAQRLQSLIDDLLEISRLESKEFRLRKERVELDAIVSAVLGLFREKAERKGVTLHHRPGSPISLTGDSRALEQILSNLVDNAVKYAPSGAKVTIAAVETGGRVRITVEDTGHGIDAKHLPRLFERFYRVDAGRARDVGGTGLGLSIVKHLAEAMGGTVSVDSTPGKGSTFNVGLPLEPRGSEPRSSQPRLSDSSLDEA